MDYIRLELSDVGTVTKRLEGSIQECNKVLGLPDCSEKLATLSSYNDVPEMSESAFIHREQHALKNLYQKGVFATLSEYYKNFLIENGDHHPAIVDKALSLVSRVCSIFKTHPMTSINEVLSTYQWGIATIRCLAWHPQTTKLAVAYSDNSVRLYSNISQTVPHLRHKLQHNVTALAWKLYCSSHLAVACEDRILIWNVDAGFLSARPNSSAVQILEYPGHTSISSLCWSPDSSLLISSSSLDSSLHVWRLAFDSSERLIRPGKGCHHVSYSPDGRRIACLTVSNHVRLWDVSTWTCDQWAHGSSDMWTVCCWSADSSTILLTRENSPCIYSLSICDRGQVGKSVARPLIDLEQALPEVLMYRLQQMKIRDMQWDSSNTYLALLVSASDNVSFVTVFTSHLGDSLTWHLDFKCVIEGEMGRFVTGFNFLQNSTAGQAILTVAWLKGEIKHINLSDLDSQEHCRSNKENPSLYSTILS